MGPDRLCHQIADGFRTDNGEHQLPARSRASIVLLLRASDHALLKSVSLNGGPWTGFEPKAENDHEPSEYKIQRSQLWHSTETKRSNVDSTALIGTVIEFAGDCHS